MDLWAAHEWVPIVFYEIPRVGVEREDRLVVDVDAVEQVGVRGYLSLLNIPSDWIFSV